MSDQWMGSIAAQDQYRPLGNDPWTNTMRGTAPAPGQGFEPVQQSPVLYNTKAGPITEADIENTIGIGMGVSGGGLKTDIVKAPGIKAYHSSPHDFDKFDLAKIGTGEGAQSYGHGAYLAENPAVSGQGGQYYNQFKGKFSGAERDAADVLSASGFNREEAIRAVQQHRNRLQEGIKSGELNADDMADALQRIEAQQKLLESGKPVGPRTYEVNIKADPAHMLDWDKVVPDKHALRELIHDAASRNTGSLYADVRNAGKDARISAMSPELTGEGAYRSLVRANLDAPRGEAVSRASSMLNEAGIPGIKYLDQGSRNATPILKTDKRGNVISSEYPPPSSNYVIFDPSIIDIMKKYGIAGAAPAGMGALAAQDAYRRD